MQFPFQLPWEEQLLDSLVIANQFDSEKKKRLYTRDTLLCTDTPETHSDASLFAVDFLTPWGTPIYSPVDGEIFRLRDDSDEFGPDPEYSSKANYIGIRYRGGSEYLSLTLNPKIDPRPCVELIHIAQNSVSSPGLGVGSTVQAGQHIGNVGRTGRILGNPPTPHLHVMAFFFEEKSDENPFGFFSRPINFYWGPGQGAQARRLSR